MPRNLFLLLLATILLITSCSVDVETQPPTLPEFVTATLPATPTPLPTFTAGPGPTASIPTVIPVEGITNTQLNVRTEPSTAGDVLGTIAPFSKVQVIGRESNNAWYLISYQTSPNGQGWVLAKYVQVNATVEVAVIEIGAGQGAVGSGLVVQPLNVRNGPGTNYDSLGTLSQDDVVPVTGKDEKGEWLQVQYKGQSGWASAQFMKVANLDTLPILANEVESVPTPLAITESSVSPYAALSDGDTMNDPSASISLTRSGIRSFQFNGSLSLHSGDAEDWIQFSSDGVSVLVEADCAGDDIQIDLLNQGILVSSHQADCEQATQFTVQPGDIMFLHIVFADSGGRQFTTYSLKVKIAQP